MKLFKSLTMFWLTILLTGCLGHGFEGEYQTKASSSNEIMNAVASGLVGSQTIVIGRNFIETQGEKEMFSEIYVSGSGENKYLVFKNGGTERKWKIVDNDTLMQGTDLVNMKLIRVK